MRTVYFAQQSLHNNRVLMNGFDKIMLEDGVKTYIQT